MKQYEFLEHTADEKFRAYGKDLEEAFANSAIATFAIMTDVSKIKASIKKEIEISSNKKRSLLYDFLSELLFLVDTEGFLLSKVENIKITGEEGGYKLKATLLGDNAENYEVSTHIKAVTYSEMEINEEKDKVTIQVVHDI